ncbi:MAG: triose-phosphate isomerase, partial [Chlamydiia bacterium]|nr:triose-phosphate isomerase [Chlamydiia bacterium]
MAGEKQPLIVANWKMYKTKDEAVAYLGELAPKMQSAEAQVFVAVPFTLIAPCAEAAPPEIVIGAQNMNDAEEGAFTGEVAAKMLLDAGARFVILGHSERRRLFGEADPFIN